MISLFYCFLLISLGSFIVGASYNVFIKLFIGCLFSSGLFVFLNAVGFSEGSAKAIFFALTLTSSLYLLANERITLSAFKATWGKFGIEHWVIGLCSISLVLNSYHYPLLAGDALAYWYQKAKFLMYWKPLSEWPTLDYPNLSSGTWYLVFLAFGDNEYIGRLFFALVVLLGYWGAHERVTQRETKPQLRTIRYLFCYYAILFSIEKMGGHFRFSNSGYMDYYLGFSVSFLFFLILNRVQLNYLHRSRVDLRLYFLFFLLGLTANIKAEGYILVGLLTCSILLHLYFNCSRRRPLTLACIILATCFGAVFYRLLLSFANITPPPAQTFAINYSWIVDRIVTVSSRVGVQLIQDYEFWCPFAFYLYSSGIKILQCRYLIFAIPIFGWISFLVIAFVTTTMPYEWHMDTALNRLLFQIYFYFPFLILSIEMLSRDRYEAQPKCF